jgi:hypothetical protein
LRSKLSRWCTLLALSGITSSITSFTVTSLSTTTSSTSTERLALALALTTHHSTGRSVRSLLLDVSRGDNLSGKVEPFPEVVETFRCESIVVILPRELGLDIATGGKRLAGLDNVEILGIDVVVLWEIVVFLRDEYTLAEEVLVDLLSVCLWNQPREMKLEANSISIDNVHTWLRLMLEVGEMCRGKVADDDFRISKISTSNQWKTNVRAKL